MSKLVCRVIVNLYPDLKLKLFLLTSFICWGGGED